MPLDSSLTKACTRPVKLPEKELSQKEVEKFWATDRKNLIACGYSKEQLVKLLKKRDR